MKKSYYCILISTLLCFPLFAQKPQQPDAAEVLLKLKKLNFLGNVLYVAAHPDDENTRLIAYMANEKLANTAYLSMTRGDGGQNLIGPEIREALGVIRTQELLSARKIDKGQQFFTRANDFGYSKSPEETQEIWNREEVLGDVVWVFRKFRPDVIITRFPDNGGGGHGHHTTSAIFAKEAFDLAADKTKYPDQLQHVSTWQPKRLYLNTGRWWNPDISADDEGVLTVNVGAYNPLLGESYTEMASRSRSQHKSQGFGSTGRRGEILEYLEYEKGERAEKDVFEDIDTSWRRVKGGEKIGKMVDDLIEQYDPQRPSAIVLPLLEIRKEISEYIKDEYWKRIKIREIDELVHDVMGLYLETTAEDYAAAPGTAVKVDVEVVNRSPVSASLVKIKYNGLKDSVTNADLKFNQQLQFETTLQIPENAKYSHPYWLREKGTLGMYQVKKQEMIGKPEAKPAVEIEYVLNIAGHELTYQSPLVYKWNDPVDGEKYRPFVITPPVFINIPESVYIFSDNKPRKIDVIVKSGVENTKGKLRLKMPEGWQSKPAHHNYKLDKKGQEETFTFEVTPPARQQEGFIEGEVTFQDKVYNRSLTTIDYDHIKTQVIMPEATAKIVKIDIQKYGNTIGYIEGAGDVIPAALREIGYEVIEMSDDDMTDVNFNKFDAIVLGIRALNTNERLPFIMDDLLKYVHDGGTLIMQYNTSHRLKTTDFAPYPLELSRDRVTDEKAPVEILAPDHQVMNKPNKITTNDFEGWVQERGLYFPDKWSGEYTAILASKDPGESLKKGGLLVAPYGSGYYVYSGYSWFRELPAGVPGAFRIFVNLVSLGSQPDGNATGEKTLRDNDRR
ncbi:MAG: PIG-L family deacetylase [Fulvivirga sp.]|nr:PIG-L family deacetylase [Fulvivirga sp.]